jgi:regulator of sigma E protease
MAVACGVKVLRFSVGFGRPLLRFQRDPDGTEFVVGALPFGGYVRMLDEREAPVAPQWVHMAFNRKSVGQRTLIVAAGPAANLILAAALYALAALWGILEPRAVIAQPVAGSMAFEAGLRSGDWIRQVRIGDPSSRDQDHAEHQWRSIDSYNELRWVLLQAALSGAEVAFGVMDRQQGPADMPRTVGPIHFSNLDADLVDHQLFSRIGLTGLFTEPVLGAIQPGSAAEQAGLRSGDRVLSINGVSVADGRTVIEFVRSSQRSSNGRQQWLVERDGQRLSLVVVPRLVEESGGTVARIGAIVGKAPVMDLVQKQPMEALTYGLRQTWEASALTLKMLGKMLVGDASLKNLSGPVTIAEAAGRSAESGLAPYLIFLALVSVSLGVLNLLPLPVLDGGHLMYYLYEFLRGKPLPDAWMQALQKVGLAVVLLMMSLALFNDVSRLAGL